jgi:hypothetical protein
MIRLKSLIIEQVGSQWNSCRAWHSKGGASYWNGSEGRPKIYISINDAGFKLSYTGRGSGYAISHGDNGTGDSLHQAFNVIMCECNPYLMKGNLKPDVNSIDTNCSNKNGIYNMNIWIPFDTVDSGTWQINRRGGWRHDPGPSSILSKVKNADNLVGPVRVVVDTRPSDMSSIPLTDKDKNKISEYFVTYTLPDANKNKIDKKTR